MRVPKYNSGQVSSVQSVNMGASVKTSVENFGGGAANVVETASKGADVFYEYKKRADQARATEAQMKLIEFSNRLMNPRDGALSKKGSNAIKSMETFPDEYQKGLSEIENELTGDQKAYFQEYAFKNRLSVESQLNDHVAKETERYDNEVYAGFMAATKNKIANNYYDLKLVDMDVKSLEDKIKEKAARDGLPPEKVEQEMAKEVSDAYAVAIQQMIASDKEDVAQEYFEFQKKRGTIKDADTLARLQKMVDDGANRKNAQKSVDEYMSSGLSESRAYDEARKIEDSELRKETEDRINLMYSRKDAARKDALEKTTISYLNIAEAGGDPRKQKGWQYLEAPQRNAIEARMEQLAKGEEAKTDVVLYRKLKDMAADPAQRNKFAKEILPNYIGRLNRTQYNEIQEIQTEIRTGKSDLANLAASQNEVFKSVTSSAGIEDKEKLGQLSLKMNDIESNVLQNRGKKLNPEEYKQYLNDLISGEIQAEGFTYKLFKAQFGRAPDFLKSGKKIIDLTPEDVDSLDYGQIPSDEIAKIEAALKSRGKSVNPTAVSEMYKTKLKNIYGIK